MLKKSIQTFENDGGLKGAAKQNIFKFEYHFDVSKDS